jgi:hypothetical protein
MMTSPRSSHSSQSWAKSEIRQLLAFWPGPMIDELGATKSQGRPILVDRDLPDGIEAGLPQNIPAGVRD